jgi:hypothetical protein
MLVHSYRTEIKMGVNCLKEVRTLQENKWWGSAKACQIVSIKHTFHLGVKVSVWIATFVLQLHLDVALELIIFGENRYYRNLKIYHMSIKFIKHQLNLDMPFLSGQISPKCFISSDGRSFSIGMQYLRRNVLYL